MDISIYQISPGRDRLGYRFMPLYQVERLRGGKNIDSSIYNKVFEGKVNCDDLEDVYQLFNTDYAPGYRGHSMSVSDVIEVKGADNRFFFCDSIGFYEVSFDSEAAHMPPEIGDKIKVIEADVNKYAKEKEIKNDLKSFQKIVGGVIEEYMPFDDEVALICNEDGKVSGLPMNRAIYAKDENGSMSVKDIICGNFFLCYAPTDSEKFLSMPDELSRKYLEMFKYPERFMMENGKFTAKPYKPKEHDLKL